MKPGRGVRDPRAGVVLAVATVLVAGASMAAPLAAQVVGSNPAEVPAWLEGWSPLQWTADLPRTLPSAVGSLPDPLLWGLQRTGQFWTAGNPAALPFELTDHFSAYRAVEWRESGSYHRPLDPQRTTDAGLAAVAWRPFETHGAAIGRVRVAHVGLGRVLSDYDLAYPTSPYVVMDTAGSALGRTDASLEGALGWRGGALGLGGARRPPPGAPRTPGCSPRHHPRRCAAAAARAGGAARGRSAGRRWRW